MADLAYSLEKERVMAANEAHYLSLTKELQSKYKFKCPCENCGIPLTLVNFGKSKKDGAKQIRFTRSKHEIEHNPNCRFNVKKEDLQKSYDEEDTRDLRYSLYDDQDIEMVIGNSVTSSTSEKNLSEEQDQKGKTSGKKRDSRNPRRYTNRRFKSLSSLVHVFRTSTSEEKIKRVIKVENEKRCMQELFVDVDKLPFLTAANKFYVYYGKARMSKPKKNNDMVVFSFDKKVVIKGKKPWKFTVPTNLKALSKEVQSSFVEGKQYMLFCMVKIRANEEGNRPYDVQGFQREMYKSMAIYPIPD